MEKVLVTGGVGFIGYHLCKKLLEKKYKVIICDNFSEYYSKKIKKQNANELEILGAQIIEGSILDKKLLTKTIVDDITYVYHLAAQPGVRFSTENPEITMRINVEGSLNVLSASIFNQVKRIVVASSSSVFGLFKYLPIDEKHPKNPISFYGTSKLVVENMVAVYRHLYNNASISIIRPFTIVGPRQRPDMAIYRFVTNALNGKEISIYGDGEQTRDWTHVDNIVNAFYLASVTPLASNEDFNIGTGTKISVNECLRILEEVIDRKINVKYYKSDKADVIDTIANIDKAKSVLSYQPIKSLKKAIEEFIYDYQQIMSSKLFKS